MELTKTQSLELINRKLAIVKQKLATLDELTNKADKLEEELRELKNREASILKDDSLDEDTKLTEFLALRGKIALKQASITALQGEPSQGNGTLPIPGKIDAAEEAVAKAGEAVAQLLSAHHAATLVAFESMVQTATAKFINEEDIQDLMRLAVRHPAVRQLGAFSAPDFAKVPGAGYKNGVTNARMLPVIWSQLTEAAEGVSGKLSVSIPDTWA
jgi:hypothetical protein